jgi:hypothetical protein
MVCNMLSFAAVRFICVVCMHFIMFSNRLQNAETGINQRRYLNKLNVTTQACNKST